MATTYSPNIVKDDLIVHLEETFPFRPDNLIDEMINYLLTKNFDSVIASKK